MQFANIFVNFVDDHTFISLSVITLGLIWLWSYLANPYSRKNIVRQPYTTSLEDGQIQYQQHFKLKVYANMVADLFGYGLHGVTIMHNTLFGGKPLKGKTAAEIIKQIHNIRFKEKHAYLISGDQFSVLYPRNLGVFYNQLLDPSTAHDNKDWLNRQKIYLQSVLYAIDGLSVGNIPKTTLIPISPRALVTTRVHPGDFGSDAVYGLLYAINIMLSDKASQDGQYKIQTQASARRLLVEKSEQLKHIIKSYLKTVQDPATNLIRQDIKLSSARDGVTRVSSFYDNLVLWETLMLAKELEIYDSGINLRQFRKKIDETFWNPKANHYNNDLEDQTFSSDYLLGYVTGFFNLNDKTDLSRAIKIVEYIENNGLADPFPIKYQIGQPKHIPLTLKIAAPNYGGDAIWSYWGAQYITLLTDLYQITGEDKFAGLAEKYIEKYEEAIVRDGGFAETFTPDGKFLRTWLYKSIRVTGWVVQFEHAKTKLFKNSP